MKVRSSQNGLTALDQHVKQVKTILFDQLIEADLGILSELLKHNMNYEKKNLIFTTGHFVVEVINQLFGIVPSLPLFYLINSKV